MPEGVVFVGGAALACGGIHETGNIAILVVKVNVGLACGGIDEPEQCSYVAGAGVPRPSR